jgi:hypothetical protein
MVSTGLVLVHGGAHAGDCWDLVVDELRWMAPDLRTLAMDLPGRASKPGDLATATLGGVDVTIRMRACHDVMISHPRQLAEILLARCRLRGQA